MKSIKKVFSLILVFSILFISLTLKSNALSPNMVYSDKNSQLYLIEENDYIAKFKEVNNNSIIISTNNKISNFLTIEEFDKTGKNLISYKKIDLKKAYVQPTPAGWFGTPDAYQNTFSNREYKIWYGNSKKSTEWTIRSKDYTKYRIKENSNNRSSLENFRDSVESINSTEYTIIGVAGATVAATIFTALYTGGLSAGAAAASGTGVVIGQLSELNKHCNNADYYFNRI